MKTYSFESVFAWQKAHAFVLKVYEVTRQFPDDEKFALTSQFRRAAVSIEANIAEGYKKLRKADKLRFFNISEGSMEECRDYIIGRSQQNAEPVLSRHHQQSRNKRLIIGRER